MTFCSRRVAMFPIVEAQLPRSRCQAHPDRGAPGRPETASAAVRHLRLHAQGERIPLTIADSDPEKGTITIIVQGIGKTTKLLNMLEAGDAHPRPRRAAGEALGRGVPSARSS